jgi:Flp pilus assembly protein TadG
MLLPIVSLSACAARFRRNRSGSAAVEFAMIAPMFFALLFAIMETGLVFLGGQMLETGVQDASRLFYTSQSPTKAEYTAAVCSRVSALMDCTKLDVDVRSYNPGVTITITDPIDNSGNYAGTTLVYQPPSNTSQTVVSRGFYQWPLFVTGLGYNIANIGRNSNSKKRLLAATNATGPQ